MSLNTSLSICLGSLCTLKSNKTKKWQSLFYTVQIPLGGTLRNLDYGLIQKEKVT